MSKLDKQHTPRFTVASVPDVKKCLDALTKILEHKEELLNDTSSHGELVHKLTPNFTKQRGLCHNANLYALPSGYYQTLVTSWKHFSGFCSYPICLPEKRDPYILYVTTRDNHFRGDHGKMRFKLAKYLCKQMKKDLACFA